LAWGIDHTALAQLETEVFGKRLLITDQHDWATEKIILAYRGQSRAEAVFRQLKDVDHLAVRPQYHWTDQKIRVHTFIYLLALLLCRLVECESRAVGYHRLASAHASTRWWLFSGRAEVLEVFGVFSVVSLWLYWSRIGRLLGHADDNDL
jgi:hypothetical protein